MRVFLQGVGSGQIRTSGPVYLLTNLLAAPEKLTSVFWERRSDRMICLPQSFLAVCSGTAIGREHDLEGVEDSGGYGGLRKITVAGTLSFNVIGALKVEGVRKRFPVPGAGGETLTAGRTFQKAAEPVLRQNGRPECLRNAGSRDRDLIRSQSASGLLEDFF